MEQIREALAQGATVSDLGPHFLEFQQALEMARPYMGDRVRTFLVSGQEGRGPGDPGLQGREILAVCVLPTEGDFVEGALRAHYTTGFANELRTGNITPERMMQIAREMGMVGLPSGEMMSRAMDQVRHTMSGPEGSNYGINPATGGWEPGMGGMARGLETRTWFPSGDPSTWSPEVQASFAAQYGGMHAMEGSSWGVNPSTGQWEPNMGGMTTYSGGWEATNMGAGATTTTYTGTTYYENQNYNNAQEGSHSCSGLTEAQKADHRLHGHCDPLP